MDEMINLAEILSKDFSVVRVDFYVLPDGNIKFGEMTFTSGSGVEPFCPSEFEKTCGDMITLPKEKYDYHKLFENN